jgi:hypothetical protein
MCISKKMEISFIFWGVAFFSLSLSTILSDASIVLVVVVLAAALGA